MEGNKESRILPELEFCKSFFFFREGGGGFQIRDPLSVSEKKNELIN